MLGAPGDLGRRHHHRRSAAARTDDFEKMERIDDHPRIEYVVDRELAVVERRERILDRAPALVDRDLRHLLCRGAVFVHVTIRDHRVAAIRADISVRRFEFALYRDDWRFLVAELVEVTDD